MGQQTLRTVITIGGNVDNTFGQIGTALIGLGGQIDMISQKIIDFGKESVTEYVNYDDLMREVQAVGEFNDAQMKALDEINRQIAKTTTYSNIQAAQAEVIMGQLGLSTAEIEALLPDVLELAMAGNLDLADSVNYLYSVLKSLGMELGDSDVLTDQMAKTAAIGATDIDTLGDALTRLGSGLQLFAGGAPEVLTILSAMSDFGEDMRGAQGGTVLRNFALSLVAPAGATKEVLAALENLGVSEDELAAYLDDEGIELTNAAAALEALGIDVVDKNGNLRSMLDIISDLRTATQGLDGDLRTQTLRQIFGKRGYVTAENLLRVTDAEYQLEYAEIVDSEGFAAEMAETMQGGLGGALRELEAAYTEFKTTIGEVLAPAVESVADWLHEIVVSLSNMDEDALRTLVESVGIIAAAGPAILGAGLAFRLIGFAMTPIGGAALGLLALGVAAKAFYDYVLAPQDISDRFGEIELNLSELETHVDSLTTEFTESKDALSEFTKYVDEASTKYEELTAKFSEELLTDVLTEKELTEGEKDRLKQYGEDIISTVREGVSVRAAEELSLSQILFGDMQTEEETEAFSNLVLWEDEYYQGLYAEAESVGQELRNAMVAALEDNKLNEAERMAIQASVDRLNQIQAQIAHTLDEQEYYTQLRKAQDVSWDSISDYLASNDEKQAEEIAGVDELFYQKWGSARAAYEYVYADAQTDEERARLDEEWANVEQELNREHEEYKASTYTKYGKLAEAAFASLMNDSDYTEAWDFIKRVYADGIPVDEYGQYDFDKLDWGKYFAGGVPEDISDQLIDLSSDDSSWLGLGKGKLTEVLEPYKNHPAVAQMLEMLDSSFDIGASATAYENRKERFESSGIDYFGEFTVPVTPEVEPGALEDTIGDVTFEVEPSDPEADAQAYSTEFSANANPYADVTASSGTAAGDSWEAAFEAAANPYITVRYGGGGTRQMEAYAEGGRADEPSIFGEAGPEWAIPEEHSERTAALIDAARAASGFTWPELLDRYGGLNANTSSTPTQIIFAPTIHANDATGVEAKLLESEERFRQWYEDYRQREKAEVYA